MSKCKKNKITPRDYKLLNAKGVLTTRYMPEGRARLRRLAGVKPTPKKEGEQITRTRVGRYVSVLPRKEPPSVPLYPDTALRERLASNE